MNATITLLDWDGNGTAMRVDDQGDSISLVTRYVNGDGAVHVEVGVRLDGSRLDALQAEISRIRALRGI